MRERSSKYDPKSQMQVTFIHLASIDYRPNNNSNNLIITAKTDKLFLQLGWFMNLMLNKINLKIKLKHHLVNISCDTNC